MPISGNVFVCHNRKLGATDTWWAEARDAAKYPVVHRTAPQSEEVPGLKCQSCVLSTEATQRTGLKDGQSLAGCPAQNGSAMFLVPPALQNFVTLPSRHGVYFIPLSMKFKRPSLFQQIECKGNSRE